MKKTKVIETTLTAEQVANNFKRIDMKTRVRYHKMCVSNLKVEWFSVPLNVEPTSFPNTIGPLKDHENNYYCVSFKSENTPFPSAELPETIYTDITEMLASQKRLNYCYETEKLIKHAIVAHDSFLDHIDQHLHTLMDENLLQVIAD